MEKIYKATASGLEFHIDTTGWADKGPAEELVPESARLYCMECGTVVTDIASGFFCSDECREEYLECREV
jgi:hypothetical protein